MKGRLVAFVGVFCIATLIVSGAYADKPDNSGKPPKEPKEPHRPGNIAVECMAFSGEPLLGHQQVVGCCPNAGPWPAYQMFLDFELIVDDEVVYDVNGLYDGHLYAKPVRTKFKGQTTRRYMVNFCTWDWGTEIPGDDDYFIEMWSDGDDIQYDETTDVLTVTFDNDHDDDTVTVWVLHDVNEACVPSYPYCETPCVDGVVPNCDPFVNPNCYHPCNEEFNDVNVSFNDVDVYFTTTTDLSYCED